MVVQHLRRFAASAAPDHADRPRVTVPRRLLLPGLAVLAVSVAAYVAYVLDHPFTGTDFKMYVGAAQAFLDGDPVYQQTYTALKLPYTYPPITLPFLAPTTWLPLQASLNCMNVLSFAALLATVWFTARIVGYQGTAGKIGLVAFIGAAVLWTEPLQRNFNMGQINVLVMLLVVADLALSDKSRFKGVGIGAATAVKLIPGLFVVYLLLTRRVRAAFVAGGTFAVLTALGAIIQPGGSYDYWLTGRAFDSHRVLMAMGPRYRGNQSLQGFTARLLGTDEQNTVLWMVAVAVVAVAGITLAVLLQRRGEEAMGMVLVGLTALMVSPVSWSHYWLWIAPGIVVLIEVIRRTGGVARVFALAGALAVFLPYLMWPSRNRAGELLPVGLIWQAQTLPRLASRFAFDPYVITTLLALGLAALWLLHLRREGRARSIPPAGTMPAAAAAAADTRSTMEEIR